MGIISEFYFLEGQEFCHVNHWDEIGTMIIA